MHPVCGNIYKSKWQSLQPLWNLNSMYVIFATLAKMCCSLYYNIFLQALGSWFILQTCCNVMFRIQCHQLCDFTDRVFCCLWKWSYLVGTDLKYTSPKIVPSAPSYKRLIGSNLLLKTVRGCRFKVHQFSTFGTMKVMKNKSKISRSNH